MLYFETKHPNEPNYVSNEYFEDFEFGLHLHPHFEIMSVSRGTLNARIGDKFFDINEGSLAFIMPMQPHSFSTPNTSKCHVCVFSPSFAPDFNETFRNKMPENPIIALSSLSDILNEIGDKKTCKYALTSHFYRIISLLIQSSPFIDRNEKLESFVEISLEYLDKNYDKEPSLAALATLLNYDRHYCSQLFNKTFGKSFPSMINEYRIFKAHELLASGNLSITHISNLCGFSSIRSFNRNFLKILGIPPSTIRKNEPKDKEAVPTEEGQF